MRHFLGLVCAAPLLLATTPSMSAVVGVLSTPANTPSSQIFNFNPPSAGRINFTMRNPDKSRDGVFEVRIPNDGATFNYTDISTFERSSTFGVTGGKGIDETTLSIEVDDKPISIFVNYDIVTRGGRPIGSDFTGVNSLEVEFKAEPIRPDHARILGIFSPGAQEFASQAFNITGPGEVIVSATETGVFGGGRFTYLVDGVAFGGTNLFINSETATAPFVVSIAFAGGEHTFEILHEDDFFGDNSGGRSAEISFVPVPAAFPLLASALVGLAAIRARRAAVVSDS